MVVSVPKLNPKMGFWEALRRLLSGENIFSPSLRRIEKGVYKGDVRYERPQPHYDLSSVKNWFKLGLIILILPFGVLLLSFIGLYFQAVFGFVGLVIGFIPAGLFGLWVAIFVYGEIKCRGQYGLANVEFMPVEKVEKIGDRCLSMVDDLNSADMIIYYCRSYFSETENEPYHDPREWLSAMTQAELGVWEKPPSAVSGALNIAGSGLFGGSAGSGGASLVGGLSHHLSAERDPEDVAEEIVDLTGGVPNSQEIRAILKQEDIPNLVDRYGERTAKFYLAFLISPEPLLPYDESTSADEMKRIAETNDTQEVKRYIREVVA